MMLARCVMVVGVSQLLMLAGASASTNRHTIVGAAVCDRGACQDVTLWIWDGDTFTVHDGTGRREKIRIENIDAPEIDGACAAERATALQAEDELATQVSGHRIKLVRGKLDRYGRRLARVAVDARDVGETLIEHGLARRWDSWRKPWCHS
ncbi:thermonuclease family protein [Shinella sp. M27]|uniref:thermonuclease family protein n=1 Tax=Shinella sp. M27 TaxID=3368614 RepID=UPI003BA0AF84